MKYYKNKFYAIGTGLFFLDIFYLLWLVIKSGYYFIFNPDEIFNANTIYLMQKGMRPYVDFYTVYSPIFHWFITPVFWLLGFSFKAISGARVVMIGLYIVRIILIFWLVKRIFGKNTAFIFLLLYLFDPFMVFAGMQIRPESLMMVVYTLFLIVFSYALNSVIPSVSEGSLAPACAGRNARLSNKLRDSSPAKGGVRMTSGWLFFLSGTLGAVALLINIKIIPSLAAFGLIFIYLIFQKRLFKQLLLFLNGFCLSFLVF